MKNNNNKKQNKKRKEREERPACSSPILTFLLLWILCCQWSWWVASCDLPIYNQEGLAHWAVRGAQNLAELLREQDGRRTNPFREKERENPHPFPQKYWNGIGLKREGENYHLHYLPISANTLTKEVWRQRFISSEYIYKFLRLMESVEWRGALQSHNVKVSS